MRAWSKQEAGCGRRPGPLGRLRFGTSGSEFVSFRAVRHSSWLRLCWPVLAALMQVMTAAKTTELEDQDSCNGEDDNACGGNDGENGGHGNDDDASGLMMIILMVMRMMILIPATTTTRMMMTMMTLLLLRLFLTWWWYWYVLAQAVLRDESFCSAGCCTAQQHGTCVIGLEQLHHPATGSRDRYRSVLLGLGFRFKQFARGKKKPLGPPFQCRLGLPRSRFAQCEMRPQAGCGQLL